MTPDLHLRSTAPDFKDLPWGYSLADWMGRCSRLEDAPRGVSRHPVVFVNYSGTLYAIKELPLQAAEQEYQALVQAEALNLPVVEVTGHGKNITADGTSGVIITRFLEGALPYRLLFLRPGFESYRRHLLDAIAGLLVQLHLGGLFWGDCSLSNTLFRRDAGALRAYLVDAETAEVTTGPTTPRLRFHELQIMEENITRELVELRVNGQLPTVEPGVPTLDIGAYIRLRYQSLWDEVTREDVIAPEEEYRIYERIRALNQLGFSVGDVELTPLEGGKQLRLRVEVTDRNFHREQLFNLTGLDAEELQAQKMMNEIHELRAMLSSEPERNMPLSVAANFWLENKYTPVVERLQPLVSRQMTPHELYCQILEHKWYLSEREQRDVGHQAAVDDYLSKFWLQPRLEM
ncbi:MAG: hypothetical protein A2W35_15490 [Chloroflexi bacterium RBG_16_57_11]|nr:MAG: hypothetical protein A2W35_15490 [Chloroflexi bacterium RBG_16_57_11]